MSAEQAIHNIRRHYGFRYSVTQIINKMKYDKQIHGGLHPDLQIR